MQKNLEIDARGQKADFAICATWRKATAKTFQILSTVKTGYN